MQIYDTGIILGHVSKNGKLSLRQIKRANKAVEMFKTGQIKSIITTGGTGGLFNDSSTPLGQQIKSYLLTKNIPEQNIFVEDTSLNTYQNAVNSLKIVENKKLESAVVITSFPHTLRAKRIFKKVYGTKVLIKVQVSDYLVSPIDTAWDILWEIAGWLKHLLVQTESL